VAPVLVIGGTLFIGRALVDLLLERGDQVTVMHRGQGTPWGSRVGEIRCDRNDVAAVGSALRAATFEVVYDNVYDWQRGTSAEQVSAAAIASASDKLRRYVFTSSVAVYPPGGPYDESDPLVPADYPNPYGMQKAESERALFELERTRGIPVATIRPAFIYGPQNPFEREAFFWDRMLAGRSVIVPEDGLSTMQWVHVGDVARGAIAGAAARRREVARAFNLAGTPITQLEYLRLLAKVAGVTPKLIHVPRERLLAQGGQLMAPPLYFGAYLDVPPITVKTDRARSELGLEFIPMEEGLRETFRWYQSQQRPAGDYAWEDGVLA
jgi:nucleoside-diphosphate-sugar epimerase